MKGMSSVNVRVVMLTQSCSSTSRVQGTLRGMRVGGTMPYTHHILCPPHPTNRAVKPYGPMYYSLHIIIVETMLSSWRLHSPVMQLFNISNSLRGTPATKHQDV